MEKVLICQSAKGSGLGRALITISTHMPLPLLFLLLVLLLLLLHLPAALPSTTAGLPPLSLSPPPFWLPVVADGAAHVLEGSSELTTRAAAAATAYQFVLSLGLLAAGWDAAERAEMVRTLTAFVESGEGRLWSAGACAPVSPTDGPGGEPTPRPSASTSSSSTSPGAVDGPLLVLPVAHYARDEDDGARARSRGEIAGAPPRQRPSASDSGSHQPQMRATLLHHCPNASALETASAFVRDHHGIPAGAEIPATLAGAVAAIEVEVARRLRDLHRQTRAFAATSCAARTNSRTDSGTGSSADSSSSSTTTSRTGINSNSNSNSNSARPPRRTPSAATSPFVSATAEVARGLVEARELPTFVINLRTSSPRLEHVHCQLSAAGFALVRAPGTDTDSDNDNVNNDNTEEDGTAGMRHPVRRFLAVDGATLTERVLRRVLFSPSPSKERGGESPSSPSSPPTQPPLPQLTQGEVGVALSHISLWKQVAVEDVPFALILEDDVVGFDCPARLFGGVCVALCVRRVACVVFACA